MLLFTSALSLFALSTVSREVYPVRQAESSIGPKARTCRKTQVAILGAGVAGITAAQTLHKAGIDDFVIIEYNSEIGGRCKGSKFGKDKDGNPYNVEIGANWIQGTTLGNGLENPILTLVKKYDIAKFPSSDASLKTYDSTGPVDYSQKVLDYNKAFQRLQERLTYTTTNTEHLLDTDLKSALKSIGYNSDGDAQAQAVDWYRQDYEYAQSLDQSSREFTVANGNSTFGGHGDKNNFVYDQRGFSTFIKRQAADFLQPNDKRLLLNSPVVKIDWSEEGVTTHLSDGICISSAYAINTFSLGVLRSGDVTFSPLLPPQKRDAMNAFQFGTFTKIFMQFPPEQIFWNKSTESFLYASTTQGYYSVFQSLDHVSFLPGSGILIVTVVSSQSHIVEAQSDAITKQQILKVLREMFGDMVPEPIDFLVPRWEKMRWARGSFSNWPPGFTVKEHDRLRERAGRMHFAGEATSKEYFGYLHGAYFEGENIGRVIAGYLGRRNHDSL